MYQKILYNLKTHVQNLPEGFKDTLAFFPLGFIHSKKDQEGAKTKLLI